MGTIIGIIALVIMIVFVLRYAMEPVVKETPFTKEEHGCKQCTCGKHEKEI